jgi:hypothetical protein
MKFREQHLVLEVPALQATCCQGIGKVYLQLELRLLALGFARDELVYKRLTKIPNGSSDRSASKKHSEKV